ncbi:MAG TPA: CHRD domain-containing protein [Acidimicrobiales bacterium]
MLVSSLLVAGGALGLAGPPVDARADHRGPAFRAGAVRPDGAQEVPGPGDADGRGTFAYVAFGDTLCYVLTARKIEPAAAAHIHTGARGVAGPIAVTLETPADGLSIECIAAQPDAADSDLVMSPRSWPGSSPTPLRGT